MIPFYLIAFLCHCDAMRSFSTSILAYLYHLDSFYAQIHAHIVFALFVSPECARCVLIVCIVCMCFYFISFLPIVRLSVTIVDEFMYQLRSMLHSFSSLFLPNISIVFLSSFFFFFSQFRSNVLFYVHVYVCVCVSIFQVLSLLHSFLLSTQKKSNKVQCKGLVSKVGIK